MINNNGKITGKLNTAIKVVLLAAFDAIPEFIVKTPAKPADPNIRLAIKGTDHLLDFPKPGCTSLTR